MKYIKVENNVVVNILEPVVGFDITECFHSQVLASYLPIEEAELGWVKQEDGSFSAPVVVTPVETPVEEAPVVTPTETPAEPTA
jgi:hypothetical protein